MIVSGSLAPQTREQIAMLSKNGYPYILIDSQTIFSVEKRQEELDKALQQTVEKLKIGEDVLLMADNTPGIVQPTKEIGHLKNIDPLTISKMASSLLANMTGQAVDTVDN